MSLLAVAERLGLSTNIEFNETGQPVPLDAEEVTSCACDQVVLVVGDSLEAGTGTLYITSRRVIWRSASTDTPSVALTYHQVMMHAISKDLSAFPKPCIYLQLDEGSEDMMQQEAEDEEPEAEDEAVSAELRLVPLDSNKIEELFKALCDCAALNPDPEIEGEGDFFFDETEIMAGIDDTTRAEIMAARMEGLNADGELNELVGEDPGRFEDAEEEEEEVVNGTAPASNGH
eukprot:CAMPEP_0119104500 /NCGR_PEP_ID=MMETSP1180-20130426/2695_1 /TAXON_ID=3052 ORGANISM="Chlamydomonas cf sp, Strain CCMP681" /NCGR_SAMPLE_ID=MMETSP1180 /ASSEMBLY_ACC=CAM_ASM_000741 /LENGTH=230 /DNA_ID=CAMNT_0007089275 /DNA_START=13 /DNA_END=705 /DNA_ORIENTATION=-